MSGIRPKNQVFPRPVVIENGAAVSGSFYAKDIGPRGMAVEIPAAWTAADLIIEGADGDADSEPESGAWRRIKKSDGTKVKITGIATNVADCYLFPPEAWAAGTYSWIRVRSVNTSNDENNVNQGAARSLILRPTG